MAERWRNNVEGAQQDDSSSTDIEPEPDQEVTILTENPWVILEVGKITHADAIRQHPTEVIKQFSATQPGSSS